MDKAEWVLIGTANFILLALLRVKIFRTFGDETVTAVGVIAIGIMLNYRGLFENLIIFGVAAFLSLCANSK